MDTKLHSVNADIKEEHTTINNQNFEEIYIKEERLDEENSEDYKLYDNLVTSVKKEECISDNDEQIDKEYKNPITTNNDIQKTKNKSKIYCCIVCNKNFTRNSNLKVHMKLHAGIKDFKCTYCEKSFVRSQCLKNHMKHHSEVKDFPCTSCNKSFTQNKLLRDHMKVHSGIKDYQCTICGKLFTHRGYLRKHMLIHSGNKKYQCYVCYKTFLRNSDLKKHMTIHTR